ncbi:hypothetical protein Q7P37_003535 [Cladosporium fusiforme]
MSSYFTLPSFARAKKNREDLEKTNPTNPVLNDADEKFLTKITSQDAEAPEAVKDAQPVQITDDGEEKQLPSTEASAEGVRSPDQIALPETQPEEVDTEKNVEQGEATETQAPREAIESNEPVPDPPEVAPNDGPGDTTKKGKKNKTFELPSQEEAEAATKGFDYDQAMRTSGADDSQQQGEKLSWSSYLSNLSKSATWSKDGAAAGDNAATNEKDSQTQESQAAQPTATRTTQAMDQARTWAQYASTYIPSTSSLPSVSVPGNWSFANRKDFRAEPVYKEDGSVDEAATKEKQEKEVSVLLDNLSLSNINNRVFSFSAESQKYYDRFTQVLKDTLNGGPTAYEDMDKLMKEAGPTLEKHFNSMPPFVQTLVKSLPAKLGTTLGPELMAAASEKPGNDLKARMAAADKSGSSSTSQAAESSEPADGQKKKRRIPGLKSLTSSNGVVASILRNIVNFLQVRFPFLVSTTNVVMSLAVFILMFVFWYCHKRGKQVRLDREANEANEKGGERDAANDDDGSDFDASDSDEGDVGGAAEQIAEAVKQDWGNDAQGGKSKDDILNQPEPAQVPLPDTDKGEKGAALEAEKSVGV